MTLALDLDVGLTGSKTEYNVIGEITGREKPEEVVVIGGHLDSWDLGTGAIDDGAGVAITMAAGQLIGQLEARARAARSAWSPSPTRNRACTAAAPMPRPTRTR